MLVVTRCAVLAEEVKAFWTRCRAAAGALVACPGRTGAMTVPALDDPPAFEGLIRWMSEGGAREAPSAIAARGAARGDDGDDGDDGGAG